MDWSQSEWSAIFESQSGKYKLAIRLDDNTDIESNSSFRTIDIEVLPPLAERMGISYLFFACRWLFVLVDSYLRARQRRLQSEQMTVFRQQKERKHYQSKIDFFTNVLTRIKTPLSLIKAPLDYVFDVGESIGYGSRQFTDPWAEIPTKIVELTINCSISEKPNQRLIPLIPKRKMCRNWFLRYLLLFVSGYNWHSIFQLDLPRNEIFVRLDKEAFLKIVSNLVVMPWNIVIRTWNFRHLQQKMRANGNFI